jgi:cathepsin D
VHTLALLLSSFTSIVFAIPRPSSTAGQSIALRRRSTAHRTEEEWARWAKNQREILMTKYGVPQPQRRSSGTNLFVPNLFYTSYSALIWSTRITNQNADSSFFGSLAIGTPPMPFNVILDTGSAYVAYFRPPCTFIDSRHHSDLWIADSSCSEGCSNTSATFDRAASSSFTNSSTQFSIQYGSGQAAGTLGQDIVQMAGFAIPNQIFGQSVTYIFSRLGIG